MSIGKLLHGFQKTRLMEKSKNKTSVLAGDIGGTKTYVGLFHMGKRRPVLRCFESYPSREASGLGDIIKRFLNSHLTTIANACFGIAGPILNGRCKTTNLPWEVSELQIKRRFKWTQVSLINDLTATSLAVPILNGREVISLNKAKTRKEQNIALIAPGTGLGEALLLFQNKVYVPVPSEGGHADFAPTNKLEVELWQYLKERFDHVSTERVLSGPGLFNIYSWLRESGRYEEPSGLAKRIKKEDPARVITEAAIDEKDPLCVESLNMFVSIFGAAAGNLALTGMTTGGVYLGGGIPPKILPTLKSGLFMKAFQKKGRFKDVLEKIPVKVILNERAALLGAAIKAFEDIDVYPAKFL